MAALSSNRLCLTQMLLLLLLALQGLTTVTTSTLLPHNITIRWDGTKFEPAVVRIREGGFVMVQTPASQVSSAMFGQPMMRMVEDNWIDVDGIGLRLVEMEDATEENRCNTGAFNDTIVTMWKKTWGRDPASPFRDGLNKRPHDSIPGPYHRQWGKYKRGTYYMRHTWGTNDIDPICRQLKKFPAYVTIHVGA